MALIAWLVLLLVSAPATAQQDEVDDPGMVGRIRAVAPAKTSPSANQPRNATPPASEDIADPDDDDDEGDWAKSGDQAGATGQAEGGREAAPRPVAGRARQADPGTRDDLVTWWARAFVRLELDTVNSGPRTEAEPGVREDVLALVTETSMSVQVRPHEHIRLQAGGRLRLLVTARQPEDVEQTYAVFNGDLHRTDFEAIPGDMMLEVSSSRRDVQAGMITTVWGANDLVNPNDILTAKDLRLGLAEAEQMRLPVLSVKADLYIKKVNVALVWQPVFTPHSVELFGGDYAVLGAGAPRLLRVVGDLAERMADDSVEGQWQTALVASSLPRPFVDSSVALRVSATVAGFDLAAHYAYGFERLPVLRLHHDLVRRTLPYLVQPWPGSATDVMRGLARAFAHAPPMESLYLRQHHVGLSFSRVLWRLVLDGDVAFVSRQAEPLDDGQGLPLERHGTVWSTSTDTPVLSYTLGARYAMGEDLLVKLEWWHELLIRQLEIPAEERADLLLGGPQRGGLALLCRYTIPRVDLTLQLMAHSELFHGSVIIAPRVEYRLGQHLALLAGATFYAGRKAPGALYDHNDQIHFGLRGVL